MREPSVITHRYRRALLKCGLQDVGADDLPLLEITTVIGDTAALPIERLHFNRPNSASPAAPSIYASDVSMTRLSKYPINDAIFDG